MMVVLVSENSGVYTCQVTTAVDSVMVSHHVKVVTEPPKVADLPSSLGEKK